MVVVVQIEVGFAAEDARDFIGVALVAEDVVADGAGGAEAGGIAHIVVGGAYEVAGVAFFDELGDGAGGHERNVIGVGLHGEEDFSLMGPAGVEALEGDAGRRLHGSNLGASQPGDRAGGDQGAAKIAP